jgi:hypothetical protein
MTVENDLYSLGRPQSWRHQLLLEQSVAAGELTWGGTTKFSGGTDPERVETFQDQEFRIPVQDLKRFDLYKLSGFDEARAEARSEYVFGAQATPTALEADP